MSVCASLAKVLLVTACSQAATSGTTLPTREQLVHLHRHMESVVFSCEARIDVEIVPTRDDMLPLIKEVIAQKHLDASPEKYEQYIFDAAARDKSYSALWFRDGAKERFEYYPFRDVEPGQARMIMVFDGGTVRKFVPNSDTPRGMVSSPEQAHWNQGIYPNPYSLLLYYYNRLVSELLDNASQYEIAATSEDGIAFRITVVDPFVPDSIFEIGYDQEWRPVRRDFVRKFQADPEPRVYMRYDYSEWETVALESGESLDISKRIVESDVVGISDEGVPATYKQEIIQLSEVRFNVDHPDDLFSVSFPKNAVIDDQLQGFGQPADDPGVAALAEQPQRKVPWLLILNVALVVVLLAAVAWQRRRRAV